MRRALLLLLPLLALAAPAALAQQRVQENATTRANRALQTPGDRDAEAVRRGASPPGPETMRAMEDDRRSLGPAVGRPEAEGRLETGGERGALTGGMNPQR